MRYTCSTCGAWVKDKFFFGTMHLCLTDDEARLCRRWVAVYPHARGASLLERAQHAQQIEQQKASLRQQIAEQRAANIRQAEALGGGGA